jgi:glycosyltransferase involved in cell wall biosynthesis
MKVLWITNDVIKPFLPFIQGKKSVGGTWVESLYFAFKNHSNYELAILTPVIDGNIQKVNFDNTIYYTVPIKEASINFLKKDEIKNYLKQINDFNPDIIHIHGTERNFGLITSELQHKIPVVISIQGIITGYHQYLSFSIAENSLSKFKSIKNIFFYGGIKGFKKSWKKYIPIEKKIYIENKYFIGRTLWDKSQLNSLNRNALYFHCDELLRQDFYNINWDIKECNRLSIFFSSAAYSIKGLHIMLKALIILKERYPNIILNVPLYSGSKKLTIKSILFGEDYNNYIFYLINKYKLEDNINFFNRLDSLEMAKQYKSNHIFVSASFIENSPNSIGEAMMVGIPIISSFVGGIGSILKDEENALLFPSGDYNYLALQIERLINEDELSTKISKNAKELALNRHNNLKTVKQYENSYQDIITLHKNY